METALKQHSAETVAPKRRLANVTYRMWLLTLGNCFLSGTGIRTLCRRWGTVGPP